MIEKRLSNENVAVSEESRHIEGYALVFDSPSTGLSSFHEVIKRGALDGVIESSDVVMTMDHNTARGILARSTNGVGSLKLELDKRGLKYSFDAPKTPLGDELLEGIRRGDIRASSFAFVVERDTWDIRNGEKYRTIEKIKQLFDVSAVVNPAYDATSVTVVDMRGADALDEVKEETPDLPAEAEQRAESEEAPKQEEENQEPQEAPKEEAPAQESEEPKEENQGEADETPESDNKPDGERQETTEEKEEEPEDVQEGRNSDSDNLYIQRNNKSAYMPKFKLINAINAIANNQPLSEEASAVNAEGRSIMSNSGLTPNGHFVLPCGCSDKCFQESRDNGIFASVATQGKEAIPTDKLDILEPLRARLVLAQAGATLLTGLSGNISLPTYSGSTAYWKGEVAKADNGEGSFGEINLSPKRLTAVLEVSKQFLIQTSDSADAMLQRDIVNAIADKLEATILGSAAGTAYQPAGLLNGVTADTAAPKHSDILEMEQALEESNVYGDFKYIASPAAKALLRGTVKGGAGSGRFLMESNEIEGIGVLSTSNVPKGGLILGQWSELVIGQWGAIDLTVDSITKADEGKVRLIINSFYDCQARRPEAIQARVLKV